MASPFRTSMALPPLEQADAPQLMGERLSSSDRPLALLPVRLETRFFPDAGDDSELRIRIYPDKFHLYSHETRLTSDEQVWGKHYWEQDWLAGNSAKGRQRAWHQLEVRFGSERAEWIARVLTPSNPDQRPQTPAEPGEALDPAPKFPVLDAPEGDDDTSWRKAPEARLMPDRWIAVIHSEGRPQLAVASGEIQQPLAAGPDPRADEDDLAPDGTGVDSGMQWMIDFVRAEEIGMALRVPISAELLGKGLDSLFVFGTSSREALATSAELAALIDGHRHTDGFAFLPLGTPTNRSEAGQPDGEAAIGSAYAELAHDIGKKLAPESNALRLGWALGIDSAVSPLVLGTAEQGRLEHASDCRSMNAAIWPTGWGYFLSNMVGFDVSGMKPEDVDWAQDHFIDFVAAAGPFATVRCGRQPYGILPVTSLDLWEPPEGQEDSQAREIWLKGFLLKLRESVWRPRLADMPRIGRQDPPNPDADLNEVMSYDAVAAGYAIRSAIGRHYFEHLRAFNGEDLRATGFMAEQDRIGTAFARRIDLQTGTRMAEALFAELPWPIKAPLIQLGDGPARRKLEPNYIAALLDTDLEELVKEIPGQGTAPLPQSLFQALLRHALLREVAGAAASILSEQPGGDRAALLRDAELVGLMSGQSGDETWLSQLDRKVAGVTGDKTILELLDGLERFDGTSVKRLGDLRKSLRHLKDLDSETLQWLLQATLDLSINRLDAWISSLANKRLLELRKDAEGGVYVGAYGWVENLVPETAREEVSPLPAGEEGPLFALPGDPGFIHAPSATHASAAALLRNAHLGTSGTPEPGSPFAINLSSRRVREAEHLLEGARMGQPLGALLGYRLERSLHELGLDHLIAPLRQEAPISAGRLESGTAAVEAIAANNVVDGLALHAIWESNPARIQARLAAAAATPAEAGQASLELDALGDSIDGLSDALTAELAYQMARGNIVRSAATISSIAGGDVPPSELEVARIPRSGTAVSHRVVVLLSPQEAGDGWADASPRAKAEPILNAWVSTQLGDPRKILCGVEQLDDATGSVAESRTFRLADLEISALDLVYAAAASPAGQATAQGSAIEDAIIALAREGSGGFAATATLRIAPGRLAGTSDDGIWLSDALEQARAIRSLLASVRGAGPEDLTPPHRSSSGRFDVPELKRRAEKADTRFRSAFAALETVCAPNTSPTKAQLKKAITSIRGFGIDQRSSDAGPSGTEDFLPLARVLQSSARARLASLDSLPITEEEAAEALQVRRHVERLKAVFGNDFAVLPRFKLETSAAKEFGKAMAASSSVQGVGPLAARNWFLKYARVRDPLSRLSIAVHLAEAVTGGIRLGLKVAQLPFAEDERWVGLPLEEGKPAAPGKLSLVIQSEENFDPSQPLSGLMVDEWTEIIPGSQETTGIAFQYNPPDSCAPQAILLAVPPKAGVDWSVSGLHRVLAETLDLAKLRTVDAQSLFETTQYLPATYMAFNAKGDAVSTDLAPLTR